MFLMTIMPCIILVLSTIHAIDTLLSSIELLLHSIVLPSLTTTTLSPGVLGLALGVASCPSRLWFA